MPDREEYADFSKYITNALRTDLSKDQYIEAGNRIERVLRLLHVQMGIVTELGELTDVLKENIFYGKPLGKDEVDNLAEETGDLLWYIALLCDVISELTGGSIDGNRILAANIAKLKARYPNKFNETDALNRDLGKEREAFNDETRKD